MRKTKQPPVDIAQHRVKLAKDARRALQASDRERGFVHVLLFECGKCGAPVPQLRRDGYAEFSVAGIEGKKIEITCPDCGTSETIRVGDRLRTQCTLEWQPVVA